MMEPMLLTEVQTTADALEAVHVIVLRRRGHLLSETSKAGSPLYTLMVSTKDFQIIK
jgi:U5 small nuclear ribonucleoprotein component